MVKPGKNVYESTRPYEITWKGSFPTDDVGYVTIMGYHPDSTLSQQYVAKTIDGGDTWEEVELVDDYDARQFGIGFIDENTGWVGTMNTLYQTTDGGNSWKALGTGRIINKIRVIPTSTGHTVYALGSNVLKLETGD